MEELKVTEYRGMRVLSDDNCKIIVSTDGSYVDVDKWEPRTEVTITELEEG